MAKIFTLLIHKFQRNGFFLLDEPEAALHSANLHSLSSSATHSVGIRTPGAQILSFDNSHLHEISYEDTAPMQIVRRFENDRESFLEELFQETPSLFDEGKL